MSRVLIDSVFVLFLFFIYLFISAGLIMQRKTWCGIISCYVELFVCSIVCCFVCVFLIYICILKLVVDFILTGSER